ncbi:unnamed protein product [Moneuplotes crassus]|uniref:Uncharacterized protein n=1 Tax=Euplotes crassus TaxID=5936 RepID=A0AAD1TZ90_EUPCR|nr:unnamed protein product [Moneuplotes crassus]
MKKWTQQESDLLIHLKSQNPSASWESLRKHFQNRSCSALCNRWSKIDPSFSRSQWTQADKQELFDKVFDIVVTSAEQIAETLGVKRHKADVTKQVGKIREVAARGYLGCEYKLKGERKRGRNKEGETAATECKRVKDGEEFVKRDDRGIKKRVVKEECKGSEQGRCGVESMDRNRFPEFPTGLTRNEFLQRVSSLPLADGDEWTFQEDQNILKLYQELGANWTRISVFTDDKSAEHVKQRFRNLLSWGAYSYQKQIHAEDPLRSRPSDIAECVKSLIKELPGQKNNGQKLCSKVKFETCANISESDDSGDSEFSYLSIQNFLSKRITPLNLRNLLPKPLPNNLSKYVFNLYQVLAKIPSKMGMNKWTEQEDELLIKLKQQNPGAQKKYFVKFFKGRTVKGIEHRWAKINPLFAQGKWDQYEKVQLFEKVFEVVSANNHLIRQALDTQRHKADVKQQIYRIKELAAFGYLGVDYKIGKTKIKPERKRESKAEIKSSQKILKFEDTYNTIENIQNIQRRNGITLIKKEEKNLGEFKDDKPIYRICGGIKSINSTQNNLLNIPKGLCREEFLHRINSLPSADEDKWIAQEDQKLLQLYQQLGPSWTQISVFTDGRNAEQVKQRFCSLLSWGAYNYQRQICAEDPLNSRKSDIDECVQVLLKELIEKKNKTKGLMKPPKLQSLKFSKNQMSIKKWTKEEDNLLVKLKQQNPDSHMKTMVKFFEGRTLRGIQQRWNKINPSFTQGKWEQHEKFQLFEKIFDVINASIDQIKKSLDTRRQKVDVNKQINVFKKAAGGAYLGPNYEVKADRVKPEKKRESKADTKELYKRMKLEETYDAIGQIHNIQKDINKRLVKKESKYNEDSSNYRSSDSEDSKSYANERGDQSFPHLKKDLTHDISKGDQKYTFEEDSGILKLYQNIGPDWSRISLSTDGRNAQQVEKHFCNLLSWGSYKFGQKVDIKFPLKTKPSRIAKCIKTLLKEDIRVEGRSKELASKIKFESCANISDSDDSGGSEFSY